MVQTTLNDGDIRYLSHHRIARLSTLDASGYPHSLPVCYGYLEQRIFITIDAKPKKHPGAKLGRLRNIEANPRVCLLIDHYDDRDWTKLSWLMLRGKAEILTDGEQHNRAQRALRERYPQYQEMSLSMLPVIAIAIERVTRWSAT